MKKRHSPEQIVRKLRQADEKLALDTSVLEVARELGVSEASYSENGCKRKRAEYRGHVWSYDFVIDRTEDGRRLKMMPIVGE